MTKRQIFFLKGIKYIVEMIQMPMIEPYVSVWTRETSLEQVRISAGRFNGLSYISDGDRLVGDMRAAINVCCSLMAV
ncbi:hypothetical protein KAR91_04625 [Candidatus Pacearchaeota archaeon]|nr:hypothetical protein [Candidatus Pacearchaeota archaeon]